MPVVVMDKTSTKGFSINGIYLLVQTFFCSTGEDVTFRLITHPPATRYSLHSQEENRF